VLGDEQLRKDRVVGERDDVGDAPELGELPRSLEAPGLFLLEAHALVHRKGVERRAEGSRETARVEHHQRSFVAGARVGSAVLAAGAGERDQRDGNEAPHRGMMQPRRPSQKSDERLLTDGS
jgi:hypothetical protein